MPSPWLFAAAFALMYTASLAISRRSREASLKTIRSTWAQPKSSDRKMDVIASYDTWLAARADDRSRVDDRTWADLDLDDVFGYIDRTESLIGEQGLYRRLRSAQSAADLDAFDALATAFGSDAALRDEARVALHRLGDSADAHDVLTLTEPGTLQGTGWYVVFPVLAVAMLAAIVVSPWWPYAILIAIAGAVFNLLVRATVAANLRVTGRAFRQISPLISTARALLPVHRPEWAVITAELPSSVASLARLQRVAGWIGRDVGAAASGEIGAVIIEYLNMVFCLDGNAMFFGRRHLTERAPELRRLIHILGEIDAAQSIASFRTNATTWTRPTFADAGSALRVTDIVHPLVPDAVPNTFAIGSPAGVIVTGSNMSGKSTFLRTLGVSVVLAQTIKTVTAVAYEGPRVTVRSCIGRSDDPSTGKSYYLVEVESVLELVAAGRSGTPHLFLFDELFRGTNAVERIAAGEAVLRSLLPPAGGANLVVAATHDRELVESLNAQYAAFHFADSVDSGGLAFDYKLRPGASTTRNAIALLKARGAPADLVDYALARADALDRGRA